MKKLKKLKIGESKLIPTDELVNYRGGGWTSNSSNTYVGINGDCYSSCDAYGGDECGSGDSGYDLSGFC